MWWSEDECAVTKIARQNLMEELLEANATQETICEK
jgi:hypothetical protein